MPYVILASTLVIPLSLLALVTGGIAAHAVVLGCLLSFTALALRADTH